MEINNKNGILRVVIYVVVILVILELVGCTPHQFVSPTPTLTNTLGVVETSTLTLTATPMTADTPTPTPEPTLEPNKRTAYQFNVDLDYNKHKLIVRQTIQYQNNTGQDLPEIKLAVPPNANSNVFSLTSLVLTGDVGLTEYALDGVILTIRLAQPLPNAGNISIALEYGLSPKLQGGILGYTSKQLNLSDWYPFVPPYDAANGWVIHQPAKVGEYLVYEDADFDLTLNLVSGTGLVIAGSVEVAPLDLDSYQMISENSRNITFSVSDQYAVLTNSSNGITVNGYIFKGDEPAGQASVDYTAKAIQLYSELFGVPYPHKTLSVVESDFPDGMEYDGLYYLSDFYFKNYNGTFQNYLGLLSVHESAHQWWFGIVGNDQALEPWLDESLATYSEYLYIERYYPELTNWWWQYRVETYKPAGRVNLTIYNQSDLRVYINAVYLQGATFLNQLRVSLGDDVFFSRLKSYTTLYANKIATWKNFSNTLLDKTDDSSLIIIQQYFPGK